MTTSSPQIGCFQRFTEVTISHMTHDVIIHSLSRFLVLTVQISVFPLRLMMHTSGAQEYKLNTVTEYLYCVSLLHLLQSNHGCR